MTNALSTTIQIKSLTMLVRSVVHHTRYTWRFWKHKKLLNWRQEKQGLTSANSIAVPMSITTNKPFKQVARAFFSTRFTQLARARATIRTFPSYRRAAARIWTRIDCVVLQQWFISYFIQHDVQNKNRITNNRPKKDFAHFKGDYPQNGPLQLNQ